MQHHPSPTRRLIAIIVLAMCGLCITTPSASAEGVMNVDQTIDISPLGDATFVTRMKMNAAQFQNWQQRYGMNPSLLRREMSKTMTPYDIVGFELDKNEMDREVTITIKARGVTTNRGDGRTEIEVPKSWRLVNQSDQELKFNYIEPLGAGMTLQGHVVTNLPNGAKEVSEPAPASGGMMRVTYQMSPDDGPSSMGLILGIPMIVLGLLLIGAGAVVFGMMFLHKKQAQSA